MTEKEGMKENASIIKLNFQLFSTSFNYSLPRFTGSAGTAVITTDKALLFTDGRYHNQAEIELGSEWTLMKQGADTSLLSSSSVYVASCDRMG